MKKIVWSIILVFLVFVSTFLVAKATSEAVSFKVQWPEGERISEDLQFVYSAKGGGYETICGRTSQSLDCDIQGTSLHNGIDLLWGDQKIFDEIKRQVVVLETDKAFFLVVLDKGLVDIDLIETVSEEEMSIIETIAIEKTQEPVQTSTPTPTTKTPVCPNYPTNGKVPAKGIPYFCHGGQ